VYSDPRVIRFIDERFVPVRVHARQQPDEFKRLQAKFAAQWTPTILLIDGTGEEWHRIEGFLPVDDFLAQLTLGLGHGAFGRGEFADAERWFRRGVEQYPATEASPEALYWAGVSRYKATNDAAALRDTAEQFRKRYRETSWAKKASVWGTGGRPPA